MSVQNYSSQGVAFLPEEAARSSAKRVRSDGGRFQEVPVQLLEKMPDEVFVGMLSYLQEKDVRALQCVSPQVRDKYNQLAALFLKK